jgi:hypothetical protein
MEKGMWDAILAAAEEPQDSKDWLDYWILSWLKTGGTEATLLLRHRNPKMKHSGPLNRIWKNEADLMAKEAFGTEIYCHSMTWTAEWNQLDHHTVVWMLI